VAGPKLSQGVPGTQRRLSATGGERNTWRLAAHKHRRCYRSSIVRVKLSVSLPKDDVALLDEYARAHGLSSRSAALRRAVDLLRHADLDRDYADAWEDWESSSDRAAWELAMSDKLTDAPR
jgi:Arc/MetJ-type ribon-helix-helix transcriptional regulator